MDDVHYGVVRDGHGWSIIGENLRFGPYAERDEALKAARRLAETSAGLPVQLHIHDEAGELLRPDRIEPET